MPDDLHTWQQLMRPEQAALREAAAACDPANAAHLAQLRKLADAELVRVAVTLAVARQKAEAKFGQRAERVVADAAGVEQASSQRVAQHKAARYRETGCDRVADLCCGIGGDAMAFADAGLQVVGVDRDPVRAWMCRQNAGCPAIVADADALPLNGWPIHLDPARRDGAGRVFRLAHHQPPPEAIRRLLQRHPFAGVKLSPAVDLDELAAEISPEGEVEFISERGRLVQAMLWAGGLARHASTATLLDGGTTHQLTGHRDDPPIGSLQQYLHTTDPAAERAALLHVLCKRHGLAAPHPKLGLLTADQPIASPWLTAFELIEQMPWRPQRVRQWLHRHDAGIIEVKTRGKVVDPDHVQQQLRGKGDTRYTVFILRQDRPITAMITKRCTAIDERLHQAT